MSNIKTIAEVMEFNRDLLPPDGLSDRAKEAYDVVVRFLVEHGLTHTGGCPGFRNPAEWDGDYGRESVLIVLHDGGDVGLAFSYDRYDYATIEAMQDELAKIGLFAEQCTTYYSAIYELR